jgi:hypothetical protein
MTKINAVEVTINLVDNVIRENMENIVTRIKSKGEETEAHTHLTEVYELTFEGGMNDTGAIYVSLEGDKLVFKGRGCYEHLTGEVNAETLVAKYITRKFILKESNILEYLNNTLFDITHVMDDSDKLVTFTPVDEAELEATGLNKDEILEGMLASYKEFLESPEKHITWEWVEGGLESTMSKVAALELFKNSIEKYKAEELEFVDANTGELAPDTSINVSWRIVSAI